MSKKIESYGNIRDGKLSISYRDRFVEALKGFKDCRVRITVERISSKRSLQANAYYWGVVIYEFCEGYKDLTGEKITPEQAHECLKLKFNSKDIPNSDGEVLTVINPTKTMTVSEFMDYTNDCIKFIAEYFGRTIPEPGSQAELKL